MQRNPDRMPKTTIDVDLQAFARRMMSAASSKEPAAKQPSGATEPRCLAAGTRYPGYQKAACVCGQRMEMEACCQAQD